MKGASLAAALLAAALPPAHAQGVPQGLPRLTGTVVGPARRTAVFEGAAVDEGDDIAGYVVRLVRPNSVQLEGKGQSWNLAPTPLGMAARPAPVDIGGVTFGLVVNRQAPTPD